MPWQQLCAETGAKLRVAPVDEDGQPILRRYGLQTTVRPSLTLYNTREEIDRVPPVSMHEIR